MINKITILIPCLNEKITISRCIQDIKQQIKKYRKLYKFEILIADNGSTDGTLNILRKIKNIKVINVSVRGYGAALHWGILNSTGSYVLYADADMSYPFINIGSFLKYLNLKPDLILGSRIKGKIEKGAMPMLHRYFGTPILTSLIKILYHIPTSDCNSGMRMVRRGYYKKLNMRNSGMEWASELLLKTALNNGKYLEVPIRYRKDTRGHSPHLSTWSDGWRHLKAIFLLKPTSIYFFILPLLIFAIFFHEINFSFTFLLLDISVILYLSLLTLNLLSSVINKTENPISKFLKSFKLVPITLLFAMVVGTVIFLVPDERLGTKLFLISVLGIVFMWIFLIETIKTHLVNRLPDL